MQEVEREKPAQCMKWLCPASAHVHEKGKVLKKTFPVPITEKEDLLHGLRGM